MYPSIHNGPMVIENLSYEVMLLSISLSQTSPGFYMSAVHVF